MCYRTNIEIDFKGPNMASAHAGFGEKVLKEPM